MKKMKDDVNAAASGEGIPTRRIAGDAGREYVLQTTDDLKHKEETDAGAKAAPPRVHHALLCCVPVYSAAPLRSLFEILKSAA